MSQNNLLRKVRSGKGMTISQLINETRLKKAWEILQEEDLSIADLAFRVGFSSPAYFSSCFKKQFDCTPGDAKGRQNTNVVKKDLNPSLNIKSLAKTYGLIAVIIGAALLILFGATGALRKEKSLAVIPFRNLILDNSISGERECFGIDLQMGAT